MPASWFLLCQAGRVTSKQAAALFTADVDGGTFRLRHATRADLPALVRLLADDAMGAGRETTTDMEPYERAFDAIDADPAHLLAVGELVPPGGEAGPVVATFQLSFLPGISRQGAWRSQLEGVRVAASLRGAGYREADGGMGRPGVPEPRLPADAADHPQEPHRGPPVL